MIFWGALFTICDFDILNMTMDKSIYMSERHLSKTPNDEQSSFSFPCFLLSFLVPSLLHSSFSLVEVHSAISLVENTCQHLLILRSLATGVRFQLSAGLTRNPGWFGPVLEAPQCQQHVPGDSGPAPRTCFFEQLSRATRKCVLGPVESTSRAGQLALAS